MLHVVLELARDAAGVAEDAPIELKTFPKALSPWEEFMDKGPSSSETAALAALELLETVRPAAVMAERLGLIETHPQILALPPEMVPRL